MQILTLHSSTETHQVHQILLPFYLSLRINVGIAYSKNSISNIVNNANIVVREILFNAVDLDTIYFVPR